MKHILFLVILWSLFSCQNPIQEKVKETHANNEPRVVNYVQEINGEEVILEQKEFYQNGELKIRGELKEGEKHGEWNAYFKNGQPQSIGDFVEGKRMGRAIVYFRNGNIRYEGEYKNDKKVGHWKFYNQKGKLIKEKEFN